MGGATNDPRQDCSVQRRHASDVLHDEVSERLNERNFLSILIERMISLIGK